MTDPVKRAFCELGELISQIINKAGFLTITPDNGPNSFTVCYSYYDKEKKLNGGHFHIYNSGYSQLQSIEALNRRLKKLDDEILELGCKNVLSGILAPISEMESSCRTSGKRKDLEGKSGRKYRGRGN